MAVEMLATKRQQIAAAIEAEKTATTAANKDRTDKAKALKKVVDAPSGVGAVVAADTLGNRSRLVSANLTAPETTAFRTISVWDASLSTPAAVNITVKKKMDIADLGGWKGEDFEGDNGATGENKVTGKLRAYSNKAAPKKNDFPAVGAGGAGGSPIARLGTRTNDGFPLEQPGVSDPQIGDSGFPTTTQQVYTGNERRFKGTYAGATGTYVCSGSDPCTALPASGGIQAQGTWHFIPDSGQQYETPDASFLEFGWWKREDHDGTTHAGVFYRPAAYTDVVEDGRYTGNGGTATYEGQAAGLFAVVNRRNASEDDSGYFTAEASLTATFGATVSEQKLRGTIDKFQLNGATEDPGWSIELEEVSRVSANSRVASTSGETGTVWTIDGVDGARAGQWRANMYDVPTTEDSDGSTAPDALAGQFEASFDSTHSMIGAFGAERE